ncbi:MAG: class I SAM-dependent methyltransferase [Clostridia bacterium]|nr:class I SAM-dependent methyltransferase [Clostridia bacterium]
MSKEADYGNWVPKSMMKMFWIVLGVLSLADVLLIVFLKKPVLIAAALVITVLVLAMTVYMQICRNIFDFNKGAMMGDVHQFLVDHLPWDGKGQILDIGCGAGALTLRCAKAFPKSELTGIDYWGTEWSYAKEQCERNAELEGVENRCVFKKGDASKLDFDDESFDAAVSNFVFHEVKTQPNKRLVVKEALRVVKKDGAFAFQDMFGQKQLYGDMNEFVEELRKEGIEEIHYIANIENQDFIPGFVTAPWMIKNAGLIYGIK